MTSIHRENDLFEDLIPDACRNATVWPEEIEFVFESSPLTIVNNGQGLRGNQRQFSEGMAKFASTA